MSVCRTEKDLMERLVTAQNHPANINRDVVSFAGFCDSRAELERHVVSCEDAVSAWVALREAAWAVSTLDNEMQMGVASGDQVARPQPKAGAPATPSEAWSLGGRASVWSNDKSCVCSLDMTPGLTEVLRRARLIAAAPDMLEALNAALHALTTSQGLRATDLTPDIFEAHLANGVARDRLEFTIEDAATLELIDAAIAKATGAAQ